VVGGVEGDVEVEGMPGHERTVYVKVILFLWSAWSYG